MFGDPSTQFGALYLANQLCSLGYTQADFEGLEEATGSHDQPKILLGAYQFQSGWKRLNERQREALCDAIRDLVGEPQSQGKHSAK